MMARPRSLDRSIEIKVFADVKALNAAMGNVNKSLGGISGMAFRFTNAVGALSQVMDIAQQIAQPLLDAAFAASDLDQAIGKSRAVFGEYSQVIESFSDRTATALGVSKIAAIDAAGSIGNVFTSLGIAQDAAAKFGMEALQLAADMGAFANLPIEEALVALRSGLVGETEPLRRFGIVVYDAAVKQKALEEGLWDGSGAMDEGAKVMARWLLIQERGVNMTGSFNREIDTMQVQLQKLQAELKDTQAGVGEGLVDPVTGLVKSVRGINLMAKTAVKATKETTGLGVSMEGVVKVAGTIFQPGLVVIAHLLGAAAGVADSADKASTSLADYNIRVGDLTAGTQEANAVLVPYSRHILDAYEANQKLASAVRDQLADLSTPWIEADKAITGYLETARAGTSELSSLLDALDDPTLRDTLTEIGKALRGKLVRSLARSKDPEDVARVKALITGYAQQMMATGKTTFVPTGDKLIDAWVAAAFAQEINTKAVQGWLRRYQAYLNKNPLTPKLDMGDWYESNRGTRPSGTQQSLPAGSGGAVVNIYAGVGDPVAIGREVSRTLGAYTSRGGAVG
jgi:hypothetical protein